MEFAQSTATKLYLLNRCICHGILERVPQVTSTFPLVITGKAFSMLLIKNPNFHITSSVFSDQGHVRANNEDNYLLNGHWKDASAPCAAYNFSAPPGVWQLMAVFDGIGGGEAGEVASEAAARVFAASLENITGEEAVDSSVTAAFQQANNRILELRQLYWVCGTTGTVLCTDGMKFKVFHLGDSRAYLYQRGMLRMLTHDHTLAQLKLDMGIDQSNVPDFEQDRHKLTHYIGQDLTMCHLFPQDSPWYTAAPGDTVLLCSDGLYDMCSEQEIIEILDKQQDIQTKTTALVQKAKNHGGLDNITCLLVAFSE